MDHMRSPTKHSRVFFNPGLKKTLSAIVRRKKKMKEIQIDGQQIIIPENSDGLQLAIAGDGGTIAVSFVDVKGITQHIYLDRRIRTKTRDHIYLNNHSKSAGTRHVGFSAEAIEIIENMISKA